MVGSSSGASFGDLVLVDTGTYAPFAVNGRGIAVLADAAPNTIIDAAGVPEIEILNVPMNTTYHGILAPAASYRECVVPAPPDSMPGDEGDSCAHPQARPRTEATSGSPCGVRTPDAPSPT